ncbi:uncharacterized protein AMSG_12029 [Thecamonas trahens ATCC 50062]|uniref:USP domain-containing protein n=1 Tax=Thecamonas trahens ATCC 50062 TaxID=461836 RepID=A0A0L0DIA6_THETB|nr:hypothetical protein AMSG_12029 [Thecamonas trahens ATCC 50062]KNC51053.1 hypothetical protein AMSG_12029 [Thecamonas trahens ATCC 50062]|eukprot:XP_013756560.1 hypothetical protein AMSG_12029 [Thecamonas trahens ATCC 50062]
MVHLKRFEFDFELLRRMKVNSVFEFPLDLNLKDWTKEGIELREALESAREANEDLDAIRASLAHTFRPDDYYQYELAGIIVHMGTADSGHYYTFVKERTVDGEWFRFNDTNVDPFNPSDIPVAAFGGTEYTTSWDPNLRKNVPHVTQKSYSAYMLLYERSAKYECAEPVMDNDDDDGTAAAAAKSASLDVDPLDAEAAAAGLDPVAVARAAVQPLEPAPVLSRDEAAALVRDDIFQECWQQNMTFLSQKNVFDPNFFEFLSQLVHMAQADDAAPADVARAAQLGTVFVVEVLLHAKDKASLGSWMDVLTALYTKHLPSARWFLAELVVNPRWRVQILLHCTVPEARRALRALIVAALEAVASDELERGVFGAPGVPPELVAEPNASRLAQTEADEAYLGADIAGDVALMPHVQGSGSLAVRFFDALLLHIGELPMHWRHFEQYFEVLAAFVSLSPLAAAAAAEREVVGRLVSFFLEDQSPFRPPPPDGEKVRLMGEKFRPPALAAMVETIDVLAGSVVLDEVDSEDAIVNAGGGDELYLSDFSYSMLFNEQFVTKALMDNVATPQISQLVVTLCKDSIPRTRKYTQMLVTGLAVVAADEVGPYYTLLAAMVAMDDSVRAERGDIVMSGLVAAIDSQLPMMHNGYLLIRGLVALASAEAGVRGWLASHRDEWVESWLMAAPYEAQRAEAEALLLVTLPGIREQLVAGWVDGGFDTRLPGSARDRNGSYDEALRSVIYSMGMDSEDGEVDSAGFFHPGGASGERGRRLAARPNVQLEATKLDAEAFTAVTETVGYLLGHLETARKYMAEHSDPLTKDGVAIESATKKYTKLVAFFRVLRMLMLRDEDKAAVFGVWPEFWKLFCDLDALNQELDDNKREMIEFWVAAAEGSPQLLAAIGSDAEVTRRMLDMFISLRPLEKFLVYNRRSLPSWYRLLWLVARASETFRNAIIFHHNFEWSIKNLYVESSSYGPVASALLLTIKELAGESPAFRTKHIQATLESGRLVSNARQVLRLLQVLLVSDADMALFCTGGGLAQVAEFIETRREASAYMDDKAFTPLAMAVGLLDQVMTFLVSPDASQTATLAGKAAATVAAEWKTRHMVLSPLVSALSSFRREETRNAVYSIALKVAAFDPELCGEELVQILYNEHESVGARGSESGLPGYTSDGDDDSLDGHPVQFDRGGRLLISASAGNFVPPDADAVRRLGKLPGPLMVQLTYRETRDLPLRALVAAYYRFVGDAVRQVLETTAYTPRILASGVRLLVTAAMETSTTPELVAPLAAQLLELWRAEPEVAVHVRAEVRFDDWAELVLTSLQGVLVESSAHALLAAVLPVAAQRFAELRFSRMINTIADKLVNLCADVQTYVQAPKKAKNLESAGRELRAVLLALGVLFETNPVIRPTFLATCTAQAEAQTLVGEARELVCQALGPELGDELVVMLEQVVLADE